MNVSPSHLRAVTPHYVCLSTLCLSMSMAYATPSANVMPDAGSLLRQAEQGLTQPKPMAVPMRRGVAPVPAAPADATTVLVSRFQLQGHTQLTDTALQTALAPYVGKVLNYAQLKQVTEVVANAYRDAGWMARAYLPKQEIDGGVVTIQIVEAVFGKAVVSDVPIERMEATRLIRMAQANLVSGQPLSSAQLDRTLLLLDDLPGVNVTGHITAGAQQGQTDVLLSVTDEALLTGNASADNAGSRSTGLARVSANVSLNSPLRMGDAFNTNLLKTQGSDYARMAYSMPVGDDGWRTGLHYSHLNYRLVGEFGSLGAKGIADTAGLDVSYPIIRSQLQNLHATLSYDDKHFNNEDMNGPKSNYRMGVTSVGLNGNTVDSWGGGGANTASVTLTQGRVDLSASNSTHQDDDRSGAATQGVYRKLAMNLSRLQSLTHDLSLYTALNMQTSQKNLDSSEKLYLGGASGVRAYPSSEGGGAHGYIWTTELRKRLTQTTTVTGFYDDGHATAFDNNNKADGTGLNTGTMPNSYALRGYGVSVSWQDRGMDLKVTWAKRVASNPIANTTTGMDGDGTRKLNRIWLSAGFSF